jgi:chaperone BCS1
MMFTRVQEKERGMFGSVAAETISISCFGGSAQILKDLLQEAQVAYLERDGNKTIIYRGIKQWSGSIDPMDWIRCMSRSPRQMSTVVLDESQKQLILDDMREYLHPQTVSLVYSNILITCLNHHTNSFHRKSGTPIEEYLIGVAICMFPYTSSIIYRANMRNRLHGPPGTGKTSLCFALAGLLHLRIYVASLNSKTMTEDGLASLFRNLPSRCIVLLEDIDAAGLTLKRQDVIEPNAKSSEDQQENPEKSAGASSIESTQGISFSGFLNIIRGVASSEGHVLVMTTNHIEKLDAALLRPGRVDLSIYFGRAVLAVLTGMFKAIYATVGDESFEAAEQSDTKESFTISESAAKKQSNATWGKTYRGRMRSHGKSEREIGDLAAKFAELVPEDIFTPAEIQGYLLRHKTNPQDAIDGCAAFVESKLKQQT